MVISLYNCVHENSAAVASLSTEGTSTTTCLSQYIQSFENELNQKELDEKELPWLIRFLFPDEALGSLKTQHAQVRAHLATAREYLQKGDDHSATDEIVEARRISIYATEDYLHELLEATNTASEIGKTLLVIGGSLMVLGSAGAAAFWIGGSAAAVYGTTTVGGLLATSGFSTFAGAGAAYAIGGVQAEIRSLAFNTPYEYSTSEQIQYATNGGTIGLLPGTFPFAIRTGIRWAQEIQPDGGIAGTIQAVGKHTIELTPVAITQGSILAAQVKISGGTNSEVAAGAALGAAIPFVYSGLMVAFRLPSNLRVLTWRDSRFPNEVARVIFYDGVERPYQIADYCVGGVGTSTPKNTRVITQRDLISFYDRAFQEKLTTDEGLIEEVAENFRGFVQGLGPRGKAIEFGYGYGNYSIALAEHGLDVTAVDRLSPVYFSKRLDAGLQQKITIVQANIEDFNPPQPLSVALSRNVLHYLPKEDVVSVLQRCIAASEVDSQHFFTIFTDITRISAEGAKLVIEDEASFATDEFLELVGRLYQGWDVNVHIEQVSEKDPYIFSANNITITCKNTCPADSTD